MTARTNPRPRPGEIWVNRSSGVLFVIIQPFVDGGAEIRHLTGRWAPKTNKLSQIQNPALYGRVIEIVSTYQTGGT